MFWTFNLSLGILATVWARFPNIGRIFVQFSGHSSWLHVCFYELKLTSLKLKTRFSPVRNHAP
jgi:hypothetical protein